MDKGRLRLLGAGVFAAWLCLAGWVALDLHASRQRDMAAAEKVGTAFARVLDGHLQATVQKVDFRLQQFIERFQTAVYEKVPREAIEKELRGTLALFPEASSFRVVDAAGNYLYDATGTLSPANIADRDYFLRHRQSNAAGLVISEPIKSRVNDRWVLALSRRLNDPQGNFLGIVVAALDAAYFQDFYSSIALGRQGVVGLWSRDMNLIARWPRRDEWLGQPLRDTPLNAAMAAATPAGSVLVHNGPLDGLTRLFSFRVATGLPLVVVVGQAEDDILAEWQHRATIYGGLVAGLGVALLALLRSWSRSYRRAQAMAIRMAAAFEEKSREGRALLDSIPDPAWLLDKEGRYLAVNEAFCRYIARPMDEVLGRTVFDLFPPEEAKRLQEGQQEVLAAGHPVRQEVWLELLGARRPLEFLRVPVYRDDGTPRGLAGVAWDMSERYEAEERRRLITHVFDHSSEAILILDSQRRVVTFNKAVTDIAGYTLDEAQGRLARVLAGGGEADGFFDAVAEAMERDGGWHGEVSVRCKDGVTRPVHCNVTPIRDEAGQLINWAVFVTDLSERKATEARIESLVNLDQLTKLPNRQGFLRLLGEWLAAGRPCAVIVLDIDQLRRVNDALGHGAGDRLITEVGNRLRRQLREGDVLGRLGGDLFGVILQPGHEAQSVETVARKLLDTVARPVRIDGSDIVATASAGIGLYPRDGSEAGELLRNADAAMHSAKDSGQDLFLFFDSRMNEARGERLRLESDLRWALPRRELVLHYQPQIDVPSGRIVGFESLLRWEHPEFGRIPPDRFIPLAEESQLIHPIGNWVLWEACRQAKAWQDAGHDPVVVAVNLSGVQIQGGDLLAGVRRALDDSGLAPQWLELEITESVIMHDPERVALLLEELKALGLRLSIDDFGTGYSSLAYLKRFPVDKIKIDRSFIRDITSDPGDAAIVRMVIGMARELEHKVVAEGVETAEQLAFLRANGCHEYQGYYCSPPVPAGAVPALMASRRGAAAAG